MGFRRNSEGYYDPTASIAIENSRTDEEARVGQLVKTIKYIVRLAGFELDERVALRDKKSGKVYR